MIRSTEDFRSLLKDSDLVEWNYGKYEGLRTPEIRATRPQWELFRDGVPEGETRDEIEARADRTVTRVRSINASMLLFSSGHFLRVLTARWLGLNIEYARYLFLSTASVSALGYELNLSHPVIRLWNDTRHAGLFV